ncbi:hypothetical protein [Amycolatopsis kentuckyensis]|uniref:hypothetical protein n=1 Tax=Amycolatopsis kentuckyensis TaxID=218823 RepID=UPI001302D467|nr:hypothetical protein [Amycolatopsis kentuckyensis]
MTAGPPRRIAAALLSAAVVVATAAPAGAAPAPHVPARVREVVTTVEWASIEVVDAGLHHRRTVVPLTRAFTIERVL